METLKIETFLNQSTDRETNEYKILNFLKQCREKFNRNKLYPELAELRMIAAKLEAIVEQRNYLKVQLPRKVKGTYVKGDNYEYEDTNGKDDSTQKFNDLVDWALPKIYSTIEEGLIIFDFVMQNLSIEAVGELPAYKDEGYILIPDNKKSLLLINQYQASATYKAGKQIRVVQTKLLRAIPMVLVTKTPEELKEDLLNCIDNIKNPAVYVFKTDLDFDFVQTILPIAKRKLVSAISV